MNEIITEVLPPISPDQVTGLPGKLAELEGKINNAQPAGDYLLPEDLAPLQAEIATKQPAGSYATTAELTTLQGEVSGKQPKGDYAALVHTHVISDVQGLQEALETNNGLKDIDPNPYGFTLAVADPAGKVYEGTDKFANFYNPDFLGLKTRITGLLPSIESAAGLAVSFRTIDPNPYGIEAGKTDPAGKVYEAADKTGTLYNPDYQSLKTQVGGALPSIQSAVGLASQFVSIDPNPYGVIQGTSDPAGKIFQGAKSDATQVGPWANKVATGGEVLTEADTKILFGSHLFTVEGRWFDLYGYPLLNTRNSNNTAYTFALQSINEKGESFQGLFHSEGLRLNGSWFGSTATLKLRNTALGYDRVRQLTVVKSAANKTATPRVLRIGDSIYQGTMDAFAAKFTGSGVQPTFIGSRINDGVTPGEGRGGWQAGDFVYIVSNNGHAPLPIGQEQVAINQKNDTRNPFIRVSTGSDDPADVKNGYIFDFRFYLNRFGFADPHIVLIDLCTNDFILQGNTQGLINAAEGIRIMVKSIKAAVPTCKIALEVPQPASTNTRWKDAYAAMLFDHMAKYGSRSNEGIYVLSSHAYTTSEFVFPTTINATDAQTGQTNETINDPIHAVNTPFGASQFCEAGFQFVHAIS